MGGIPSVGGPCMGSQPVFMKVLELKPLKTPNSKVDKRNRGLNPAPPVYQFRVQNSSATGGAQAVWNFPLFSPKLA